MLIRSQPKALSCLCECAAPRAMQRMPGQQVHASAAAASMNYLRHHVYEIGFRFRAYPLCMAPQSYSLRTYGSAAPTSSSAACKAPTAFPPYRGMRISIDESTAPLPNGEGIGLRSRRLQVRDLLGSLLYYGMLLGKRAFTHLHATRKVLLTNT
jgi:hypothetical protein